MQKKDINISLQNTTLTVSGERTSGRQEGGEEYVHVERVFGNFHRTFPLSEAVDVENVEASYADCVLTIDIPKTEESTARQIEVQ